MPQQLTITVRSSRWYVVGESYTYYTPDDRPWKIWLYRILGLPYPVKKRPFIVRKIINDTQIGVEW